MHKIKLPWNSVGLIAVLLALVLFFSLYTLGGVIMYNISNVEV